LQDPAGKTFWPDYKGRDGCRTPFPWDGAKPNAGFGSFAPWLPVSPDHLGKGVAQQLGDPDAVLALYKQAISLRKANDALRVGDLTVVEATETLLLLERQSGNQTVLCAFNFSDSAQPLAVPAGTAVLASPGSTSSSLAALGYLWLQVD